MTRLAALSVDLDEIGCYAAIHGLPTPAGDAARAIYRRAVPRFERLFADLGVPATFFVSTGIVDTTREFQHDIEKGVRGLPNMSWDQIRELHADGHEIGAHTVNHVNIAKVDDATAEQELTEALARVRQEIGVQEVAYAYCFGKRTDITPERRELARRLGYSACYAAYGGTNTGEIDRFDIKRFGVNYGFSETAFRAKIEGCPYGGGAEASG